MGSNQTPQQVGQDLVAPNQGGIARWYSKVGEDGLTRTMKAYENVLEIKILAGDSGTLTFPNVKESSGQMYLVRLLDDGTAKEITGEFPGLPPVLRVNGTFGTAPTGNLTADDDFWLFLSMGSYWIELMELST